MAFPSTLSIFTRPNPTDRLNSPSHSALHNTVSSALGQVEAVIGVEGDSSVVGTIEYLIKSPASNGGGHVQAANKGGTGQTTYTKGDVLVAQSSSVLTKLAVGADGAALTADSTQATGVAWATVAKLDYQAFSVTGIWTKPAGISPNALVVVQLWGSGGSGARDDTGAGSGGGGGSFNQGFFKASVLGATEQVNLGLGGASVAANFTGGNAGGNTVFGASSILTAYGGGGGGHFGGGASGGGGGGGISGAGVTSTSNSTGGSGGSPNPYFGISSLLGAGTLFTGIDNIYGGGGGGGGTGGVGGGSYYGGGGGGSAKNAAAAGAGGATTYGGGGGGGAGSGTAAGGTSFYGGAGGLGGSSVVAGTAGTAPAGGGGGAVNGNNSGAGARGEARIWIV